MYSAGSPTKINVTLYREAESSLNDITLTRSFYCVGGGYLSGEPPEGLATDENVPVVASIRVLSREPDGYIGDGSIAAKTVSLVDGSWFAGGLSTARKYDVVGRLDGRNDVIVSNVTPIPTNRIYTTGEILFDEITRRFEGALTVVGGIPPYTLVVVTPPPDGMTVSLNGREITVSGAADPLFEGSPSTTLSIVSGNGVVKGIMIGIGSMIPPLNLKGSVKVLFRPTRLTPSFIREP